MPNAGVAAAVGLRSESFEFVVILKDTIGRA